ncbi:putative disease resistance protein RGA3 [Eucalyptus grandis]|uniref:putative disease resistance protein RGA3 n=1 Tax=Eucalyptus grandis TaxID=71139 RepID=UPI00192EFCDD|nr:putative disease resistance protein RGA3 [Eucalyptus grandis]
MAEAVLFNLATDILKLASSITFSKIQLVRGARDELDSLKDTVETIRAVLLDAEKQQWHNHQLKHWLGRLKDVLYDVQDLLDDVATEDLMRKVTPGNKVSKAVRIFFSKSNPLAHRLKVANEIRELKKRLDRIANDKKFHLEQHLSEETMTIVRGKKPEISIPDEQIIGRGKDKEKIKQLLFDSSSSNTVSFVSIVGKGGLGKTALAQLVFNDGEVENHFNLKMWVCVSDVFDVNLIIKEILESTTSHDHENKLLHQLQTLLRKTLDKKKYLLVLDDMWNESRLKWLELGAWLEGGEQRSKILVTTRSHKVAKVMDAKSVIHVLHGLPEDKSWNLFRKMAFGDGTKSLDPELEKIGQDMVKKCAGVPLAIRTIGCLLYGKEKDLWLRYKGRELPEILEFDENDGGILQVLKFSYDHLPSSLKHCFAYCSLFPKNHVYKKEVMINLWVAQGFIESQNGEDNLEEVAENYLSELLCRSFLDATKTKGDNGEVLYFQMHDLMHDLAQKVAGGECKIVNFKGGDNDRGIRHALFISENFSKERMVSLIKTSKLRTCLYLEEFARFNHRFGELAESYTL